jgi:hypothetical protein
MKGGKSHPDRTPAATVSCSLPIFDLSPVFGRAANDEWAMLFHDSLPTF